MARYKVLVQSFVDGKLVNPGDEVEYAGAAIGPNLKYLSGDKPAGWHEYANDEVFAPEPSPVPDTKGKGR